MRILAWLLNLKKKPNPITINAEQFQSYLDQTTQIVVGPGKRNIMYASGSYRCKIAGLAPMSEEKKKELGIADPATIILFTQKGILK